jgi:hypothetical protein
VRRSRKLGCVVTTLGVELHAQERLLLRIAPRQ